MIRGNYRTGLATLIVLLLLTPFTADAAKMKTVSGLVGAQDSKSRQLLRLSPNNAKRVARSDLLAVLQSSSGFTTNNSHNVVGMTFVTKPYWTNLRYVCREDRVTLQYRLKDRYDANGVWQDEQRRPVGVEAQPTYHIEQLPVPGIRPGIADSYKITVCDENHPGPAGTWFAATNDIEAVRAANMFRMAEDEVKAGRLKPEPCDDKETDACRQWVISLDDLSKIEAVEPCEPGSGGDTCYVVSFADDSVEMTIIGKVPRDSSRPITPTSITSVDVENVMKLSV
jgi:hypothetical protein